MEFFVDIINEDNGNICRSLAMLVNELMMTVSESSKSMTMAACYKSRVDAHFANRVVSW